MPIKYLTYARNGRIIAIENSICSKFKEVRGLPRPRKCRRVCRFPQNMVFLPEEGGNESDAVILTVDEYETIRLIDKEGLSQEQCSVFMQVARGTVQQIYANARRKLADVLVDGFPLRIEGGDYRLCDGRNNVCDRAACFKQKISQKYVKSKGETIMRVAVTYENGEVFQHFGHTAQFKVYDIENGVILSTEVIDTNGSGHGALAGILNAMKVDVLICGGIGGGARTALEEAGIRLYGGVSGNADEAVEALLSDRLVFNPEVHCDHHHGGGDHHGEGHHCGEDKHGCAGNGDNCQ